MFRSSIETDRKCINSVESNWWPTTHHQRITHWGTNTATTHTPTKKLISYFINQEVTPNLIRKFISFLSSTSNTTSGRRRRSSRISTPLFKWKTRRQKTEQTTTKEKNKQETTTTTMTTVTPKFQENNRTSTQWSRPKQFLCPRVHSSERLPVSLFLKGSINNRWRV